MTNRIEVPVGTVLGSWTVLEELETRREPSGGYRRWMRCQCKCGLIKEIRLSELRKKGSTKCRKCRKYKREKVPAGTVFGSWTVLEEVETQQEPLGAYRRWMRCQCQCGLIKDVKLSELRKKGSTQCRKCSKTTHGKSTTPEYSAWKHMHIRCYDTSYQGFHDYGGRGVHVCERWHRDNPNGFANFLEDMGKRPSANHSLDKDMKKPGNLCYCPQLCCWATSKEQMRHRRNAWVVENQGRKQCVSAWAEELGMTRETLRSRLARGWSVERALSEPVRKRRRCE